MPPEMNTSSEHDEATSNLLDARSIDNQFQEMISKTKLHIRAGWADSSTHGSSALIHVTDGDRENIYVNFHIHTPSLEWTDAVSIYNIFQIRDTYDKDPLFPEELHYNYELIEENFRGKKNIDFVLLKKLLTSLEIWLKALLMNIRDMNKETKELIKQFFFRSAEKIVEYEKLYKVDYAAMEEEIDEIKENRRNSINRRSVRGSVRGIASQGSFYSVTDSVVSSITMNDFSQPPSRNPSRNPSFMLPTGRINSVNSVNSAAAGRGEMRKSVSRRTSKRYDAAFLQETDRRKSISVSEMIANS